jgi:tRNA A-37 threonylcarbamoyl transferase component Bud32
MPTEPRGDPLLGLDLGGYVVTRLMASGGMGLVYEARHQTIGRRAAIKVLKPEVASDAEWTRRFLVEARAIAALNHRNIVEILNFGHTPDGRQYLMMAYHEGEPLDATIARLAPMPIPLALALIDQVFNGLAEAHKKGVVHRDLKPSNVMLLSEHSGELLVKLLDFGLARQDPVLPGQTVTEDRAGQAHSLLAGTPEYIAPEQAMGHRVAAGADLYSAGVMLFQMLTGRLPFQSTSVLELLRLHVHAPAPRLREARPSAPLALESFVADLLHKDPAARPASADDARARVRAVLGPEALLGAMAPSPRPAPAALDLASTRLVPARGHATTTALDPTTRPVPPRAAPPRAPSPAASRIVGAALGLLAVASGAAVLARLGEARPARALPPPAAAPTAQTLDRVDAGPSQDGTTTAAPGVAPGPPAVGASVAAPPARRPSGAAAPSVARCVPSEAWRAQVREALSDLQSAAATKPEVFEQVVDEGDAISRLVQSASSTADCERAQRRLETLRGEIAGAR